MTTLSRSHRCKNADNPAQGVTLVIADRADAAVAWEPMISSGMRRRPDLDVIFSVAASSIDRGGGSSSARVSSQS